MNAILIVLAEHGFEQASFEKVARLAEVSRPSIYRRWKSKDLLVIDAVNFMLDQEIQDREKTVPGNGLSEIYRLMDGVDRILSNPTKAKVIITIIAEAASRPSLATLIRGLESRRRNPLLSAMAEAQLAGDIAPTINKQIAADALLGAMYFRRFISHASPDGLTNRQIVDGVLGLH